MHVVPVQRGARAEQHGLVERREVDNRDDHVPVHKHIVGADVAVHDLARQAANSAVRADAKETAAQWLAFQAVREAEVGNAGAARQAAARALALAPGRYVKVLSALALARSGESVQSKAIMEALKKSESSNTFLKVYWFPVLEAAPCIEI